VNFKKSFVAASLITVVSFSAACSDSRSILDTLPGQWIDVDRKYCDIGRTTVSVSADRQNISFSHSGLGRATESDIRQQFNYRVGAQRGNRLHLELENETRLDERGEPVTWDLVMLSSDEFCWSRSDWPEDGCTASVFRCES